MKKVLTNSLFTFILGAIIFSGITGVLAYKLAANQVGFTPSDSTWQVSDVDNALDSLFDMATYGDASASDIVSGKTALVNGAQVTGNLTVPNYTTLANTENVGAGSSSSARTGYYYLDNYKVTCGTTTCPSYTSLTGTASISPGGTKSFTNGYYNMSNYKVSCSSCPSCPTCTGINWNVTLPSGSTKSISVTNGHYYLLMRNSEISVSGAQTLYTTGNLGTLRSAATYIMIVKATSSTLTFPNTTSVIHLGS